jgi:hypothetical protein
MCMNVCAHPWTSCFQEIFQGQKYKMLVEDEGFVHKLVISNPTLADMGKYTCDVNGVITEAFLEVEGKPFYQIFIYSHTY